MAALLRKTRILAYVEIRVGLGFSSRLALAFFDRPVQRDVRNDLLGVEP
jgi:hypothetical protein